MSLDIAEATGIAIIGIILIAILGNLMTLFVISRYPPLRDVTGMFLANLAVADLLQAIIGMPLIATSAFRKAWVFGNTLCVISGTTNSLFCITSVLTLTAVSIDRYLAIVHPLHYQDWLTVNRAKFALVYIWVQALFAALLPVFGWSRYVYLPYEFICTVQWEYDRSFTIAVWSSCFLAPVLVTVVCYSSIGRVAFKHAQERQTTLIGSLVETQQNPDVGREKLHDGTNSTLGKENPVFTGECKGIVDVPDAGILKLSAAKCVENEKNPTLDDVHQAQDTHSCVLVSVAYDPSKWVGKSSRENAAVLSSFPNNPTANNNFVTSCKDAVVSFSRPSEGISLAFSAREAPKASVVSLGKVRKSQVGPDVPGAILDVSKATTNAGLKACKTSPGREEKTSPKGLRKLQSYLTRVRESMAERRTLERRDRRKEMRMAFILLIVNGSFVLCWLPHFVGALCLTFTDGSCPFPDCFFIITTTLAMLNSGCNPFIYTLTYKKFRMAFKRVMPFFRSKS